MDVALTVWLCFITLLSAAFCTIHIQHLISLWKYRHLQHVKKRRPKLLLIYAILTFSMLLLVIPNLTVSISIYDSFQKHATTYFFLIDSIYDTIFCAFINIIAIRVWLLFYDHKFAMATVDRNWRNIISPNDSNFFLDMKQTLGNDNFLLKIIFPIYILIIIAIEIFMYNTNNIHTLSITNLEQYLFISLRIAIGIPVSIFIFIITRKIKNINDEFNITNELQYLSYLLYYISITSIISLILLFISVYPIYIFDSILYFMDIIFICSTSYVQTGWILKHLLINLNKMEKRRISMINNRKTGTGKQKVPMVEILRNQQSFEAFMRHCVNELSVESVLFLVEVAQYKASLCTHNAPDRVSQFFSINVEAANIRQILIDGRDQRNTPIETQYEREYSKFKFKQLQQQRDSNVSVIRKNEFFSDFQRSILDRDWMPIAWHLRPFNQSLSESIPPNNELTMEINNASFDATKTQRDLRISMVQLNSISILAGQKSIESNPPISPITQNGSPQSDNMNMNMTIQLQHIDSQRTSTVVSINTPKTCSVSSDWIRDFAYFLYDKYIRNRSDLSVNVSSNTRKFLINIFSIENNEELFEYIVKHSGGQMDKSEQCPAAINQQLLVNTYLYHIFDNAFEEIWNLIRENSFLRFTFTDSYKQFLD